MIPPFDVKKTICVPSTHVFKPEQIRAMKSVNLMCFLLDDVTFGQLYSEKLEPSMRKIAAQAQLLSDPINKILNEGAYTPSNTIQKYLVKADGTGAFDKILAEIAGKNVILGKLFTETSAVGSSEEKIASYLHEAYSASFEGTTDKCELEHLCCPFLHFQQYGTNLLTPTELGEFLNPMKDKKLLHFYTERKHEYVRSGLDKVMKLARTRKILHDNTLRYPLVHDKNDKIVGVFAFPPANGLTCNMTNDTCTPSGDPEDFCNTALGSCSAASTP